MSQIQTPESLKNQSYELNKEVDNLDADELPTANIIVAGITGTGKSTLINSVFGKEMAKTGTGRPITPNINDYNVPDIPVRIWDTVGLELDSEKTEKSIRGIRDTIAAKTSSKDLFDRIHAIWYCIASDSNRYQGAELEFIKELYNLGVPFIIVMTKCISDEDNDAFEAEIRKINIINSMDDIEIVRVLAKDYKTRLGILSSFGLDVLVKKTTSKLPDFIKRGFIAAQRVDVVNKRIVSEKIILEYVRSAKKGFWDKVPIFDYFKADKRIRNMTKKLGGIYNAVLSEDNITKIIDNSGFNFKDAVQGLLFDLKFKTKVDDFLKNMKDNEGYSVEENHFTTSEKVARMVAYYGYTFLQSIDELWNVLTEEELNNVEILVDKLIKAINIRLAEARRQ